MTGPASPQTLSGTSCRILSSHIKVSSAGDILQTVDVSSFKSTGIKKDSLHEEGTVNGCTSFTDFHCHPNGVTYPLVWGLIGCSHYLFKFQMLGIEAPTRRTKTTEELPNPKGKRPGNFS